MTPINPLYTPREIAHQLKDSGARFLVTVPGCAEKAVEAVQHGLIEELLYSEQRRAQRRSTRFWSTTVAPSKSRSIREKI